MGNLSRHRGGWSLVLIACIALCALAACGRTSSERGTQIAAKVNREEISVHQVNYFLRRQGVVAPEQADAASRHTLEALVDQEVAVQAALAQRLDQEPVVVQSLEAARREVLARAYAERLAEGVQPPSTQEVKQYFDSKPALFGRRRLYTLVDTAVEATPEQQKALKAQVQTTRSAAEVATLLRKAGLRYGARRSTVGAETLPLHAVDAMAALNEGQSLLVGGPRDAHIYTVVDTQSAPLNLEEARGSIQNFLLADKRRTALEQQIKTLRSAAQIEYRGRFAEPAPVAAAPSAGVATPATATNRTANTAAPAPDTVALERGARDLSKTSYSSK